MCVYDCIYMQLKMAAGTLFVVLCHSSSGACVKGSSFLCNYFFIYIISLL